MRILNNCVSDGDKATDEFLTQMFFNEEKLQRAFSEYKDIRYYYARYYRCEANKNFFDWMKVLCNKPFFDHTDYILLNLFFIERDVINPNRFMSDDNFLENSKKYDEYCEQLKQLLVKKIGNKDDYSNYENFINFFDTVTGLIVGRDCYNACCKLDKDFISDSLVLFQQKIKDEILTYVTKMRKAWQDKKFASKVEFEETLKKGMKEKFRIFGFNLYEEVNAFSSNVINFINNTYDNMHDLNFDLSYHIENFFSLLWNCGKYSLFEKDTLNDEFKEHFGIYILERAVDKYCNSTANLKIESLLKNLIKSISYDDDNNVGKFSDVLNQPSNYDKLTKIFDEMFKMAYSVKFREWIC